MITIHDIFKAYKRINRYIKETPLEFSQPFTDEMGTNVYLKLENLQVSGSFKPRGGFNKILKTRESNPKAEFIAPTAGGHGVGLSYAGKILQAPVHILMPEDADPDRKKDIANNGASIRTFPSVSDAQIEARRMADEKGYIFVSAYNDREMIEGGGTMAIEMLKQNPDIDCVVCGVGGGGYLAGLGIVLKSVNPGIKIYGVQQENSPFLAEWFQKQEYPADFHGKPSIAEGIGGKIEKEALTWRYVNDFAEDFIIVSEEDIKETVKSLLSHHKHYTEPSGAVGLAGMRKRPDLFKPYKNVATIVTGRNMSYEKMLRTIP